MKDDGKKENKFRQDKKGQKVGINPEEKIQKKNKNVNNTQTKNISKNYFNKKADFSAITANKINSVYKEKNQNQLNKNKFKDSKINLFNNNKSNINNKISDINNDKKNNNSKVINNNNKSTIKSDNKNNNDGKINFQK